MRVSDTDRDGFIVEGKPGKYIVASTNIPTKVSKRGRTPDEIISGYEEVSEEELTKHQQKVKAENKEASKTKTAESRKDKKTTKQRLVEFFNAGDLYNKNRELFILKEGFDPEAKG